MDQDTAPALQVGFLGQYDETKTNECVTHNMRSLMMGMVVGKLPGYKNEEEMWNYNCCNGVWALGYINPNKKQEIIVIRAIPTNFIEEPHPGSYMASWYERRKPQVYNLELISFPANDKYSKLTYLKIGF